MSALPFTSSEYLKRQEIVLDGMPDNSVLVIPTNRKAVRSNDVNYPFRPSSYIMYLCGWTDQEKRSLRFGKVFVSDLRELWMAGQ